MTCILEAVEITQWLRFVVFPEDLNSDRGTYIGWLIVSHNSNARRCDTLFWPLQAPVHTWHIYTPITTTTTKIIKILQIFTSMPSMGREPPCRCCSLWKGCQCPELVTQISAAPMLLIWHWGRISTHFLMGCQAKIEAQILLLVHGYLDSVRHLIFLL